MPYFFLHCTVGTAKSINVKSRNCPVLPGVIHFKEIMQFSQGYALSYHQQLKWLPITTKGKNNTILYASLLLYRLIFLVFRTGVGVNPVITCKIVFSFSV